jgi:hypothetical protein
VVIGAFDFKSCGAYIGVYKFCEHVEMQNVNHDEITRQVRAKIDSLPQRELISEADARAWVTEVVGKYGELALWHAARAGGFGGSQIGALVRNYLGERADHEQSARSIVEGALLMRVPDETNAHMRRGIAMEPQHRRWFLEKYGCRRDVEGFALLSKSVGTRPWMRYSPDDLVFMDQYDAAGQLLGSRRVLIDYKAPSSVDQVEQVSFQYICQLHMGRLVCESAGLAVDELMLSQFDWANWGLKDDQIIHMPELDALVEEAGDHYWGFVMRGEVPPYVNKPRLDADAQEELRATVGEHALRLAGFKAMANVLNNKIKELEGVVKPAVARFRLGAKGVSLNGLNFSASAKFDSTEVLKHLPIEVFESLPLKANSTKRYDEEAMRKQLKDLGVNVKQFALPANVDGEALYDALLHHGLDADALCGESLTARVDGRITAQVEAWFEREYADFLPMAPQSVEGAVCEAEGQQKTVEVVSATLPADTEITTVVAADGSEQDGREGQEMPRYVPRPEFA